MSNIYMKSIPLCYLSSLLSNKLNFISFGTITGKINLFMLFFNQPTLYSPLACTSQFFIHQDLYSFKWYVNGKSHGHIYVLVIVKNVHHCIHHARQQKMRLISLFEVSYSFPIVLSVQSGIDTGNVSPLNMSHRALFIPVANIWKVIID